jgi:hypothetical protein
MVIMSDDPYEGALSSVREKRTFVYELAAEHPNHPKPRYWAAAS